jgi:hypothetical protein
MALVRHGCRFNEYADCEARALPEGGTPMSVGSSPVSEQPVPTLQLSLALQLSRR